VEVENILVVDDEEAIREVVSTMLESKGYHCTAVSNGRAAQDQVKRTTPDLGLSDMIMPEMDGIKFLEWLRQYDPEVPVIMVTAIHDISTALEAIRRGAYDYILKPFEKDQLFLGVGRALQHRKLILENRTYQRSLEQLVEERTAQLTAAFAQLEQSYDDTLEALGSALDLKDAETEGHCQRVTAVFAFRSPKPCQCPALTFQYWRAPRFYMISARWPYPTAFCASPVRSPTTRSRLCASTAKSATTC